MRPGLLSALGMTFALAVGIGLGSWLAGPPAFVADRDCERLLFTENPGGFLKRVR
jgi:hypothetical protein